MTPLLLRVFIGGGNRLSSAIRLLVCRLFQKIKQCKILEVFCLCSSSSYVYTTTLKSTNNYSILSTNYIIDLFTYLTFCLLNSQPSFSNFLALRAIYSPLYWSPTRSAYCLLWKRLLCVCLVNTLLATLRYCLHFAVPQNIFMSNLV